MDATAFLRSTIKAGRKRRALWVRALDFVRLLARSEGRAVLWTRAVHGGKLHQTTPDTRDERYPELFDLAFEAAPDAKRILSFGCSTGEELIALRRRFPDAEIVGVEINRRSRRIAARRVAGDPNIRVRRAPDRERFDLVFALAVLQREPHRMREMEVADLSPFYPFAKFDSAVRELAGLVKAVGLLCLQHAHYRIEDSSVADELEPVDGSPRLEGDLYGRDGRLLRGASGATMFRKKGG
jgi:hypothetical protein